VHKKDEENIKFGDSSVLRYHHGSLWTFLGKGFVEKYARQVQNFRKDRQQVR